MKTILVIEDNHHIQENIKEILQLANYKVITADNGKLGATLAIETVPDLVICDIMMPELDGYGVFYLLQKNKSSQDIPFIFLTAKAEHSEIRKGMELGADDYITKPFTGIELLSAVEIRLKKRNQLKANLNGLLKLDNLIGDISGKEALLNFIENRSINKFKKKQIIYTENNRPTALYFLQKGKVKAYKINDDGKELVVKLYDEGEFMGYTALIGNTNYKETAQALEDADVLVIPTQEFEALINGNQQVLLKFLQLLANNIDGLENQLLSLAYNSLRKKVADTLITISSKYKKETGSPYLIIMSRDNMANIAGTAKESLIRTLSDFKDEHLINIVNGDIEILNERKLTEMLN